MKAHPHKDPVTAEVYEAVRRRDLWQCVASALPLATGANKPCEGRIELDHVHGRGLGRRGPSTRWNCVSLCQAHHLAKTNHARVWRFHLDWYLRTFEPSAKTDPEAAKYIGGL